MGNDATVNTSPASGDRTAVILGGARTPFGRFRGSLASLTSSELGAHAIRHALERSGVAPDQVQAVIVGQVIQAGAGQGPAPAGQPRCRHRLGCPHRYHQQALPLRADRRD